MIVVPTISVTMPTTIIEMPSDLRLSPFSVMRTNYENSIDCNTKNALIDFVFMLGHGASLNS
jgi:hypothetical protein